MKLKNYTTEVPADRSLQEIERLLVQFGATNIMNKVLSEQSHELLAVGRITHYSLEWAKPKYYKG